MTYTFETVTALTDAVDKAIELGMSPKEARMELESHLFHLEFAGTDGFPPLPTPTPNLTSENTDWLEDDPPVSAPAEPEKPYTIKDVRAVIVETLKRVSGDAPKKIVMKHGGKVALPGGGEGPSLAALPTDKYTAVAAALKALPTRI